MTKVIFVCWGNICRSPIAERVARKLASDQGLDLEITSAAVSSEELGAPIDRRAANVLTRAGYDASNHRAHRITAAEIESADLVVAAEPSHIQQLLRLTPGATNVALLNDFNPAMPKGTPLSDPWYGPASGFNETLADVEAAVPGVLAAVAGR